MNTTMTIHSTHLKCRAHEPSRVEPNEPRDTRPIYLTHANTWSTNQGKVWGQRAKPLGLQVSVL